jgi:hypothetical protein
MSLQSVTVGAPRALSPTGRERRRSARKPHIVEAFVLTTADGGERVEVASVNLSRHGVGFLAPRPLVVSGFYLVEIGFGEQKLVSEIRVVSCRQAGDVYDIGAEFC